MKTYTVCTPGNGPTSAANAAVVVALRNLAHHFLALWEAAESAVHHDGALGLHALRSALTALNDAQP